MQIDMKIFTLTALLSSTMIYNVFNAIDEKCIKSLHFLTNLFKYI